MKRSVAAGVRGTVAAGAWLLRWVARERQMRAARRELERMDDHMLNDLGITRADIADVVRRGKATPDAQQQSRHPYEAKRAAEVVELHRERDVMGALIVHGPWSLYSAKGRRRNDAA